MITRARLDKKRRNKHHAHARGLHDGFPAAEYGHGMKVFTFLRGAEVFIDAQHDDHATDQQQNGGNHEGDAVAEKISQDAAQQWTHRHAGP